jgi:hypothetical protein
MESIRMAANDPVFFLNHANVDRIWTMWQDTHPDIATLYDDPDSIPNPNFNTFGKSTWSFSDVAKLTSKGGCYRYSTTSKEGNEYISTPTEPQTQQQNQEDNSDLIPLQHFQRRALDDDVAGARNAGGSNARKNAIQQRLNANAKQLNNANAKQLNNANAKPQLNNANAKPQLNNANANTNRVQPKQGGNQAFSPSNLEKCGSASTKWSAMTTSANDAAVRELLRLSCKFIESGPDVNKGGAVTLESIQQTISSLPRYFASLKAGGAEYAQSGKRVRV